LETIQSEGEIKVETIGHENVGIVGIPMLKGIPREMNDDED